MAENQNNRSREQCIALRLQGYSQYKIAEMLGVSQTTVRYHTRHLPSLKVPSVKREYSRARTPDPDPLPPSEDLAYFLGIFAGDGNLYRLPSGSYQLSICCDLRYPDLIQTYHELLERLTGCPVRVQERHKPGRPSTWAALVSYSAHFPILFDIPSGAKKSNGFEVPKWLFADKAYLRVFLRGLIETDGGVYCTYHNGGTLWYCAFTAKVPAVVDTFERAVVKLDYPFKRYGPTFRLSNTSLVKQLITEIGVTKRREYRYERPDK
jgi:Predicted transcriptional regulator